jgi:LPS sulfotransferase NodH
MAVSRFDYFIVFAEMRTGSNFLETNLNAYPGLICHGEAFNPHFIGYPNKSEILGITQAMRDADPQRLIEAIKHGSAGLGGFRYFHDHDQRVLGIALSDPRCAKIVLTRNPVESYVSWKIAQATGQWKLTNVKKRKDALAVFDREEFEAHLNALHAFQVQLLHGLQVTGQTAFYIAYEDLQDVAVMNGLARFLGQDHQLESLDDSLKKQNPEPLSEKVANFDQMADALARLDRFNLSRTPNFEPRRGAAVPGYVAGAKLPLLYMPVRSGPEQQVLEWMAAVEGVPQTALETGFTQKTLRQWMRTHPGHRSFTVLRHPVARAHAAFCQRILMTGPGHFAEIRRNLRKSYGLSIPEGAPGPDYDRATHRSAFIAFLEFLKLNLAGQTPIRVDAAWATQLQVLQGFAHHSLPDMVLREDEIEVYLPALAQQVGKSDPQAPNPVQPDQPFALADIYDDQIEALVSTVYQRDYIAFGFVPWTPSGQ